MRSEEVFGINIMYVPVLKTTIISSTIIRSKYFTLKRLWKEGKRDTLRNEILFFAAGSDCLGALRATMEWPFR